MISKQDASVFIVDDDPEWCYSLKWLLESLQLKTATYNDGHSYLEAYDSEHRGCLLIDIRMPGISGLQLQEQLNERGCQIPIIIVSGHADIPLAVRAMKAGAFDFITKPFNEQQLLDLVYKAIEHDGYRQDTTNRAIVSKRYDSLTAREREIMDCVIAGRLSKQIASDLGISIKTVESHRSHLMHKLEVRNLAELFKFNHILKFGRAT